MTPQIEIHPLTSERWNDLEALFGPRGACAQCWCMWFRLPKAQFDAQSGEGNRWALRQLAEAERAPGLLAYVDGQPAGWLALGPREDFPRLERSRSFKKVDEQPVWSMVCFFVAKAYRHQGINLALIQAGLVYARQNGAQIVEAYPVDPNPGKTYPDLFIFYGMASTFRKAGFVEAARRAETRPILRYFMEVA